MGEWYEANLTTSRGSRFQGQRAMMLMDLKTPRIFALGQATAKRLAHAEEDFGARI